MKHILLALSALALSACSVMPREPLAHSDGFRPVYPVAQTQPQMATGAIYNGVQSEAFFGRGRAFQIGDVITVILDESTQAGRTQSGVVKRTSSNDVVPAAMGGGLLPAANLLGGTIKNEGSGTADQTATLKGSVAVSVIDVMSNGNLVLRG